MNTQSILSLKSNVIILKQNTTKSRNGKIYEHRHLRLHRRHSQLLRSDSERRSYGIKETDSEVALQGALLRSVEHH
jgi:hypothetical protein